jgi:hypothetical protein
MSMKNALFNLLCGFGRQEILRSYNSDSCIISTAVALDVLQHFGFHACPLSVRTTIYNAAAVDCMKKRLLPRPDQIKEWADKYGSWTVGIGFGERQSPAKWPGHLVALHEDTLIDLSLDQATRPKYEMNLTPMFGKTSLAFVEGDEKEVWIKEDGCVITYQRTYNESFSKSPDWSDRKRRRAIVLSIIQRAEELVDSDAGKFQAEQGDLRIARL